MARLPFLQVPQDVMPKARMLARILRVPEYQGLGLAVALDAWALETAPDGDLSGRVNDSNPAEAIAWGVGWEGDPAQLLAALVRVRLVEEDGEYGVWVLTIQKYADALDLSGARAARASKAAKKLWERKKDAPSMRGASSEHARRCSAMPDVDVDVDVEIPSYGRGPVPAPLASASVKLTRPVQTALVEVPSQPSRQPKPGPEPKTTPDERAAKEAVEQAYLASRGEAYPWRGGDWKALRECLALAGGELAVLEERWVFALSLGGEWAGCSTLHQLASKWPDVLTQLQKNRGPRRRDVHRERALIGGDVPDVPGFEHLKQTEG